MSEHEWCRDTARDEAVRAAEDAAAVPSIQHRDLPQAVAELRERVGRLEQTARPCGGTDPASSGCAPGEAGTGLRTERVTLEIVYDPQFWHDPSTWAWSAVLKGRTKTVRVVEEADTVSDEAVSHGVTLRALAETRESLAAANRGIARLAAERDAAREEAERLRARVAELEQQIKLDDRWAAAAPPANAGGEAKQEPVAWAVLGRGIIRAISVSRSDAEDAQSQFACDTTLVPLYAAPPEPRGWLTAEERSLVESLRATFQQNADGLRSAGSVGHAENWERRVRILDSLLARSSPPRVKVPMAGSTFHWIAAIREAGGEVEG